MTTEMTKYTTRKTSFVWKPNLQKLLGVDGVGELISPPFKLYLAAGEVVVPEWKFKISKVKDEIVLCYDMKPDLLPCSGFRFWCYLIKSKSLKGPLVDSRTSALCTFRYNSRNGTEEGKWIFGSRINLEEKDISADLTIRCNICIWNVSYPYCDKKDLKAEQFNSLWEMFKAQEFTDVKLIVEGVEIHCHKSVLAAGSPMFRGIFNNPEMMEKDGNTVTVKQYSLNCMKKLLEFMYKSEIEGIDDIGQELYVAADFYLIEELVDICEDCLSMAVDEENVLDILALAGRFKNNWLVEECTNYILTYKELMDTAAFKQIIKDDSELSLIFIKELVKNIH